MIIYFDQVRTRSRLRVFDTDEKDHSEKKNRRPQNRKEE